MGWMDENGVDLWMKNVWDQRPGALLKPRSLLVWDAFSAHISDISKRQLKRSNSDSAVIPGGLPTVVQP